MSEKTGPAPGWVDSHCHLDFPEFDGKMDEVRQEMRANGVTHALCISVNFAGFPKVLALAEAYDNFFATVGVHPDHEDRAEVDPLRLVELARHPRIIAIGETGLDYYRVSGDLEWQRERFRATYAPRANAGSLSLSIRAKLPRTRSPSCGKRGRPK